MIVTQNWLREWVDTQDQPRELAHLLTMAGLEVDAISDPFPTMNRVVVGFIEAIVPHPSADKLRVCTVNVGLDNPLTIVCGAKNVDCGQKVPVVLVDGSLPGGMVIQSTTLRGVVSEGMICSEKELGLQDASPGIMVLSEDAPIGLDFKTYCEAPDSAFELGITPNRGDCFSIWGIAREIAALTQQSHRPFMAEPVPVTCSDQISIRVEAKQACPHYCVRVINGLDPAIQTPLWMRERLRRCGLNSISFIVDVTNYVMWLTGQPLHAFDATRIQGALMVRYARENECITLLDGTCCTLNPAHLVIADEKGLLALAGIKGGERAMVRSDTHQIVLEAAHFDPIHLAGKARKLGLHTDASHRFERGVDPRLPVIALEIATQLILTYAGGKAGPVISEQQVLAQQPSIELDCALIKKVLGIEVPYLRVQSVLQALGFTCRLVSDTLLTVQVPSHRFDVKLPVDLIEEIARMVGYDHIPEKPLMAPLMAKLKPEKMWVPVRVKQVLVDAGYHEAINYSFIASRDHTIFFQDQPGYTLTNPLSSDLSVMRRSLIPGLVKALSYNQNRQMQRIRFFEMGRCFEPQLGERPFEYEKLAGLIYGALWPLNWEMKTEAQFYHLKSDVERVIQTLGDYEVRYLPNAMLAYLHPGQSARIELKGQAVGVIGVLHPQVMKAYKLKGQPVVFELDIQSLQDFGILPHLQDLPKFPSVKRDLALVVDEACPFEKLRDHVIEEVGSLLQSVELFDIYRGDGLECGKKSFALSLILQDLSRTLKEEELTATIDRLLKRLNRDVGATLRE